jgi:peptidoglycan-N-acetylglucosamine deacetylase
MTYKKFGIIVLIIIILLGLNAGILYFFISQYKTMEDAKIEQASSLSGRILWHGNPNLREIALTFDDGPSSRSTPRILEILKQNNIKATFFVLGKFVERNKDVLKMVADGGHVIGNHTFTHASGKITDLEKIRRELQKTDILIKDVTGQSTMYFRPPFGFENWRFLTEAELMGYHVVLWTLDVADWDSNRTSDEMVKKIIRNTKNGSIILLHDGGAHRDAVIEALPEIIKAMKNEGYKFVTIDEMIMHL